jgi:hypothetical protein
MRNTMIAAAAALALMGVQAAHADAVQRYETGATLQHMAAPQQARPSADAGATGIDNGRFRQAAAEATGVDNGAYRAAQAEGPSSGNQAYGRQLAAAEETGVDNGAYNRG